MLAAGFLPAEFGTARSALFVFAFVFGAGTVGPLLAPHWPRPLRWIIGSLGLLAVQSIVQTIWYYAGGSLNAVADGASLSISLLVTTGLSYFFPLQPSDLDVQEEGIDTRITAQEAGSATLTCVAFAAAGLFILTNALQAATNQTVNSPWPLLPAGTFAAFAILFAAVFLAAEKTRKPVVASLVALALGIVASLTALMYPLGYGFDGFLHRASENVILATGTLHPAPPSYIGQYTFITWLSRVLHIPNSFADVWFVTLLALLFPLAVWKLFPGRRGTRALVSSLLALPLGILAATTPQNVAYLLGLLALLWLIPISRREVSVETQTDPSSQASVHWVLPWSLLGWSLATHPLAGLPFALVGIALSATRLSRAWLRWSIFSLSVLGTLLAVPLAFALRAWLQTKTLSLDWLHQLGTISTWLGARLNPPATHLALWPDWANWQVYLFSFILLLTTLFAAVKDRQRRGIWLSLMSFGLAAAVSSWLLQTSGDFSFLISYERQDYAARLLVVAQLFWVPAAIVGFGLWFEQARAAHPRLQVAGLFFGIAWFSANVYNALPRNDAGMIGHGWSVGRSDLETVQFIDKQANGQAYTVLANQTVSAAAISSFGFKRYVGDVFYYPIPTGGPLYEDFLQMMDHPSLDIVEEAGDLGQSKLVYVVINKYWTKADQLVETLKGLADRTWSVERGAAYIFLFDLSKASTNASTTRSGS